MYSRGQEDKLDLETGRGKALCPWATGPRADGVQRLEGSSPVLSVQDSVLGTQRQVFRTPPGSESGA